VQQALNHLDNPVQTPNFQVFNWTERTFHPRTQPSLGKLTVIEGVGAFGFSQPASTVLRIWISAESKICYDRVLDRDGLDYAELIRQWQLHEKDYFERTNAVAKADLFLQT
jgi:dephospho-CoA kinase